MVTTISTDNATVRITTEPPDMDVAWDVAAWLAGMAGVEWMPNWSAESAECRVDVFELVSL